MLHTILNVEEEKSTSVPKSEQSIGENSSKVKLSSKHLEQCCGTDASKKERGLNREWIEANCHSVNQKEASELLGYPARSGGIVIEGANGQSQLRPDHPWSGKLTFPVIFSIERSL